MIGNRFRDIYSLLLAFLASTMIVLIALLFFEYRFFHAQAQELVALKQQYYSYLQEIEKKTQNCFSSAYPACSMEPCMSSEVLTEEGQSRDSMEEPPITDDLSAAEASDDPDDDDEYVDDSFVVINRQPEYLKQSTLEYVQGQDLDALMTAIDMNQWSDYTEKTALAASKKKETITSKPEVKNTQQAKICAIRRPIKNFGLEWPIDKDKFWLSSLFGARKRIDGTWGFHHGIDMAAVKGTAVKAARGGVVLEACFQTGYGNTVVIAHNSTVKTRYAHLHAIRAHAGQRVNQGTVVGTVGETGFI